MKRERKSSEFVYTISIDEVCDKIGIPKISEFISWSINENELKITVIENE